MLRNFITTSDLTRYDVAIERYLPQGQDDWSVQIAEAFEQIKDKLRQKNLDVRKMGLALDLNRKVDSTDPQHTLQILMKTGTFTGTHIEGQDGFRRFVVDVSAITGNNGYVLELQGSNDLDVTTTSEPQHWSSILTLTATDTGESSFVFQDEYQYYRLTLTSDSSNSITYRAALYENYQDRWVIWLTLSLIYRMISKGAEDAWLRKSQEAYAMFENAFEHYPFDYDLNGDNLPERDELYSGAVRLFR